MNLSSYRKPETRVARNVVSYTKYLHSLLTALLWPRSRSAPPELASTWRRTPQQVQRRRKKRQRQGKKVKDADALTLEKFATEAIREHWLHLAERICNKRQEDAKAETNELHLRLTLPKELFEDWAFHNFTVFSRQEVVEQLYQTGFLRNYQDGIQLWCSRRQLKETHQPTVRTLIENGAKILKAQTGGFFAVVFNRSVIIYFPWDARTTIADISDKTLKIVNMTANVVVTHRKRVPGQGTLGDFAIVPGNLIAINLVSFCE